MLEQGSRALVINTGSKQGITNAPGSLAYNVSKAALRTYTEGLQHELRNREGCHITAHLLVPGWTTTGKSEHSRARGCPIRRYTSCSPLWTGLISTSSVRTTRPLRK
jgi:short-subunit dehydrogenase